jgi:peptidoglycan/xylan/chitin deacetylase (PgdA/CDA1 family)
MTQDTVPPRVALTFEAGGDTGPVDAILLALQAAQVQATFFLDGQWVASNPGLLRRIAAGGHELGNHGYLHPDWTSLGEPEILADLRSTEELVRELTGREMKPWARPPFGATDPRVMDTLARAGYHAVYRDAIDGGHWPGDTNVTSIRQRALQSATDGAVIVLHTNVMATAEALPSILDDLRRAGFGLGTLSALGCVPQPHLERHPDFEDVLVNPGYIRPRRAGRWQSLNLLEMGARAKRPSNLPEQVAQLGQAALHLLTGDGREPMDWMLAGEDHYVLVLAGELRCAYRDDGGSDLGYLIARTGDLFLCPSGVAYQLAAAPKRERRWIAVRWLGAVRPE